MRAAYYDGAPGVLVSGVVWLASSLVCHLRGVEAGIWALLIGGALIHPISLLVAKALGRAARTEKGHPLESLALASTAWLLVCCAMAYGLSRHDPAWFFPAMMATIGSRYVVFATVYGLKTYLALGATLLIAGIASWVIGIPPMQAALQGGLIEIAYAAMLFRRAGTPLKEDTK